MRDALDTHLVLYLPDQSPDRFQLSRVGRHFGPPFLHPLVNNGFADCPGGLELLRNPEDSVSFGGSSRHADVTWMTPSGHVSTLHGIEIPEVGGDTACASTIAAFEALSPAMQEMLRGLQARHCHPLVRATRGP